VSLVRWWRREHRVWLSDQRGQAERAVEQSRGNVRRVEAIGPRVAHMVGRLDFYSRRNGFSDAFELLIQERSRDRAGGG
jgi:hypothetical protein